MPVYTLQPGQRREIKTSSRYLSIISLSGAMTLDSPSFGLKPIRIKSSWQLDLDGIDHVYIENQDSEVNTVEMQDAGIKITGSSGGGVNIENKPVIQRIEESIQVTAEATVQNGTMTVQSHNILNELNDVSIPAGQKVQILAADPTKERRTVILQNISATDTKLRVGGSTVAAGRGAILKGSEGAIASLEFDINGALYVHNESGSNATVSVMYGGR